MFGNLFLHFLCLQLSFYGQNVPTWQKKTQTVHVVVKMCAMCVLVSGHRVHVNAYLMLMFSHL